MNYVAIMASWYLWVGLIVLLDYMVIVGGFISEKYGCSLIQGVGRFERAGSVGSNLRAVGIVLLTWPSVWWNLYFREGQIALWQMVDENDY